MSLYLRLLQFEQDTSSWVCKLSRYHAHADDLLAYRAQQRARLGKQQGSQSSTKQHSQCRVQTVVRTGNSGDCISSLSTTQHSKLLASQSTATLTTQRVNHSNYSLDQHGCSMPLTMHVIYQVQKWSETVSLNYVASKLACNRSYMCTNCTSQQLMTQWIFQWWLHLEKVISQNVVACYVAMQSLWISPQDTSRSLWSARAGT